MSRSRPLTALLGAVVTVVTAFVPFSPLLGGTVAGYLQRGDSREGAVVGALSGLFVAVPFAVLLTLVAAVFVISPGPRAGLGLVAGVFLVGLLLSLLYTVPFSAAGGVVGAYVAREYGSDDGESGDGEDGPATAETDPLGGDATDTGPAKTDAADTDPVR
jgi:hypothetical protein